MKPILFNTEMVQAILEGRKTVTRRVVKHGKGTPEYYNRDKFYGVVDHLNNDYKNWYAGFYNDNDIFCGANGEKLIDAIYFKAPYKVNDVLYVRETWHKYTKRVGEGEQCHLQEFYGYKASIANSEDANEKWKPSIHMPKAAARIFLRVTNVRVERLQDITKEDMVKEGLIDFCEKCSALFSKCDVCMNEGGLESDFMELWDSTIKRDQLKHYGWESNPYVWVIEFEQISKEAAIQEV